MLTVDNENLGRTSWSSGGVDEVDVVLSESHGRLVVCPVRRCLGVCPVVSCGGGSLLLSHVKEPEVALRKAVEDVRVMIEDSDKGRKVEVVQVSLLS